MTNDRPPPLRADARIPLGTPNARCRDRRHAWCLGLAVLLAAGLWLHPAVADDDELHEPPLTDDDRQHWAFRPLARVEPPAVKDSSWPTNEIDRFILARLEHEGLAPQPRADRRTLLRRVTFDLTGLPPTRDETAAFLADDSPDAWARVVDRLLSSPTYGEHWGQHWLDLARFAETDGYEHDKVRPEAWRYRDWVIDALHRNLPFDEFIRQQIAGDELRPDDPQAAVATGFLLAGPDMPDINLKDERRHMVLNEITSTCGAVFLGLQVGCAQCHDHKFEPISQADFYRLRAVFEPAELFASDRAGRVVRESGKIPVSHFMIRGDFRRPGPVVEAAFPRVANLSGTRVADRANEGQGSGRRAALAQWLTRPDHPLVPRVMANWIWQQHFGQGLTRTPGDFGLMGEGPSHAELLDWLATELPRQGWDLKRFHRLLVSSATYRQSTGAGTLDVHDPAWEKAIQLDPENRLLWRMNRRRLTGEEIRDAMLAAADQLSSRRGGPGIMAPLPQELVGSLLKGQWKVSDDAEDHRRRSVYLFVRRNLRYPLFEAFDRPDTMATCPRRNTSTTAPQALVLLNSEFSLTAGRDLASYVARRAGADPASRVELVYDRTLSRLPSTEERRAAITFADTDEGLIDLCLGMFNLNEFIYID